MTLYEWLDCWVEIYKSNNVKPNTMTNYKFAIKLIKENLANKNISEYKDMDLQKLLNKLSLIDYSKSTIRIVKLTLTQVFRKAIKQHYILENPADELVVPMCAKSHIVEALTSEEEEIIKDICKTDLYGDVLLFLFYTGLRKFECCNLKWSDFNETNKYIKVKQSKTVNGIRTVPLSPTAYNIIMRQPRISKYIFTQRNKSRNPITKTVLRRTCERIQRQTDIKLTPHICRHTFATRIYENTNDIKTLSDLLGHSNVSFTIQRYVSSDIDKKRKLVELLK